MKPSPSRTDPEPSNWKRDVDKRGPGNAYVKLGSDCRILTRNTTKKSIMLSGWGEYDTITSDIYFAKNNKLASSVPNKTDWIKLGL